MHFFFLMLSSPELNCKPHNMNTIKHYVIQQFEKRALKYLREIGDQSSERDG